MKVETLANGTGVTVPAQNVTAGNSVTVYSNTRDTYGNYITNVAATAWSLANKTAGVANGDLVPAGDSKSAVFTGHVVGTATIHATSGALTTTDSGTLTVGSSPVVTQMYVTLPGQTFVGGSGNSGSPTAQTAGTAFNLAKLIAVDQYTNIATSYTGSKTISYIGPGGAPIYTTTVSFTSGQSTTTLATTLTKAESTTITATDGTLTGIASSPLTVNAGAVAKLQLLLPGEVAAPGLAAGKTAAPPLAQTVGTAILNGVTVNAVDANWNLVTTGGHNVIVTSSDPNAVISDDNAGTTGNLTTVGGTAILSSFNFATAGANTITATDAAGTLSSNVSAIVTVNAGVFAQLQILAPGEVAAPGTASGKTGAPSAQQVGLPVSLQVNAVDANWNLIQTNDTMHIVSSDVSATLPADAELVNGAKTFNLTFNAGGSQTATVSDVSNPAITAGTTASISLSANNQTITFNPLGDQFYGTTITLGATASSGLTVSYAVTAGPAFVTGNQLTLTDLGSVTVQASQAGNAGWNAATPVSQTFNVGPEPLTVNADSKTKAVGTSDPALTYRITSGSLYGGDTLSGSLARVPGEALGSYAIQQGTLSASANYVLTFVPSMLFITTPAPTLVQSASFYRGPRGPSHH